MCSSKPKIPKNTTPPAPLAPEAGPDSLMIGNDRELAARGRGIRIMPRPDLSGLGNQDVGTPISKLLIRPAQRNPVDPAAEIERLEGVIAANNRPTRSAPRYGAGSLLRGGSRT